MYNISYKHNKTDIMASVMLTYTLIHHRHNVFLRVNNRISINFKQ